MKLLNFLNKTIEYSFYFLLFFVPLAFTSNTSELFEFNKLWITFIITIVIAFAWISKMILLRQFRIQRTIFDIPILLFLLSQVISTIFSIDRHVSLWGYYSRFNGGLLSIISYIFLYYAFVSNFKTQIQDKKAVVEAAYRKFRPLLFIGATVLFFAGEYVASLNQNATIYVSLITVFASFSIFMLAAPQSPIRRLIYAILSSAVLVTLWGLPSHFGYDPTCLLFRGTFDVSCWTADFQPKARIFSTMGQPDWLAAYLATLIPVGLALFLEDFPKKLSKKLDINNPLLLKIGLLLFVALMYLDLLFTTSRSVIVASWVAIAIFLVWFAYCAIKPKFVKEKLSAEVKLFGGIVLIFFLITFFIGLPFALDRFTFRGIMAQIAARQTASKQVKAPTPTPATAPQSPVSTGEFGGTDSGTIRLLVWRGAIDIWRNNPIFGTGVETFAFAYYKYRPAAHNLTSEWRYLYNKAHNEYLNYAATTGTVGILTYLSIIGLFLFVSIKYLWKNKHKQNLLAASLVAGYIGIIVSNFFGFSVVMINIFFFLIPGIFLILLEMTSDKAYAFPSSTTGVNFAGKRQLAAMLVLGLIGGYAIYSLITYWNADKAYYLGENLDNTQAYQKAYPYLKDAVSLRPGEPVFQDEFAVNNAVLAILVLQQNQKVTDKTVQLQNLQVAKQLVDQATAISNQLTTDYPNNITFWKTRVRIFYTLSQADPQYITYALDAIRKAAELAPTDADVSYNLGVLEGQAGDLKGAVATLQNTIKLKIDYSQPYYALGIFYRQLAVDSKGKVVNAGYNQKAIDEMKLLVKNFGANPDAQNAINTWSAGK